MYLPNIIYDIKLIMHGGRIPDDTEVDNRLLIQWINNQRALWLYNEYNKGRDLQTNETQNLDYVNFEVVDDSDIGIGKVLRSTKVIPRTIKIQTRDLFNVYSIGYPQVKVNYVSREAAIYAGNGIFNANQYFVYKDGDYLKCKYGKQNTKTVIPIKLRVNGVFENPLEVDEFNEVEDDILLGRTHYPISQRFLEYIKAEILKLDASAFYGMSKDIQANDAFDKSNETK